MMSWRVVRTYALVLACAVLWCRVEAATIPARLPSNVTFAGGAFNVSGTAVGGAVAAASTVAVEGAVASIPVTYRLGQLAGVALKGALRANAVIAGAQTLGWLLNYGIKKCQDGTWCTSPQPPAQLPGGDALAGYQWNAATGVLANSTQELCPYAIASLLPGSSGATCKAGAVSGVHNIAIQVYNSAGGFAGTKIFTWSGGCAPNYALSGTTCVSDPNAIGPSATDTDWAKVPTTGIPDNVLTGVMTEGKQFLPATPEVTTAVQTVPLSSTYKDPTTGQSYRDFAYVTPNPNDPQTANLQVVKTQVDPATGAPVTDPNTGNTTGTAKPDDPCAAHPDRVGCMTAGDVPQVPDLGKDERRVTITPDAGWGADTAACPADIVIPMHVKGAQSTVLSYQPVCKAADMFRPAILGVAWIVAVLIALGMGFKGGSD